MLLLFLKPEYEILKVGTECKNKYKDNHEKDAAIQRHGKLLRKPRMIRTSMLSLKTSPMEPWQTMRKIVQIHNLHCFINYWNNKEKHIGKLIDFESNDTMFSISTSSYLNLSSLYFDSILIFFLSQIPTVWSQKLYFLNNSERITGNIVVSVLFLFWLIQSFWCGHHHT